MLRLPDDRIECPLVEPSQRICPHWSLVVLHQAMREAIYMAIEAAHKCSKCAGATSSADRIKYTPIMSPTRSLSVRKRVCFVRHGEGAHNQTIQNWGLVDPELTPAGEAQVQQCSDSPTHCTHEPFSSPPD